MSESDPIPPARTPSPLLEPDEVLASVREATRRALAFHRRIGNPVAAWEKGRLVLVAPEDIPAEPTKGTGPS